MNPKHFLRSFVWLNKIFHNYLKESQKIANTDNPVLSISHICEVVDVHRHRPVICDCEVVDVHRHRPVMRFTICKRVTGAQAK